MKSISLQYQELKEGKMNKHQFLRNARMMFPNFVTNHNSYDDSVKILKSKGLLNEGDAVKGTPDKAPDYSPLTPDDKIKYKKVEQSPEVQEQDGIYPATTLTDIPKQKPVKKVKNESDGLEPIKPKDTKNEMKVIRIVKESKDSKKKLTENLGDNFIKSIDINSIEVEDVDMKDYPDFSDAFISYAEFNDGTPLNDTELDELNSHSDIVYDAIQKRLYESKFKSVIKKMIQETLNQLVEGREQGSLSLKGIDTEYNGDYYEGDLDVSFVAYRDRGSYDTPPSFDIEKIDVEFSNLKKYDENTNDFIEVSDQNLVKAIEDHVREEKYDDIMDAINQYED